MFDWQVILNEHGSAVWNAAYRLLGNDPTRGLLSGNVCRCAGVLEKTSNKKFQGLLLRFATAKQ
jgi:hypothetical protein